MINISFQIVICSLAVLLAATSPKCIRVNEMRFAWTLVALLVWI